MISAGEIEVFPGCIHHLLVADKDLLAACVQYSSFAKRRRPLTEYCCWFPAPIILNLPTPTLINDPHQAWNIAPSLTVVR
jgi:hypothetical protein